MQLHIKCCREKHEPDELSTLLSDIDAMATDLTSVQYDFDTDIHSAFKAYNNTSAVQDHGASVYARLSSSFQEKIKQLCVVGLASESDVCDEAVSELPMLVRLAGWSKTPVFDRASYDIVAPATLLAFQSQKISEACHGKMAINAIPEICGQARSASEKCTHLLADIVIPQLTFLCGDQSLANTWWERLETVGKVVDNPHC